MRIIAGTLGGRLFDSPGTYRTHPMSDKIRGALFAMLGDVDGLTVLDAFSGSGALSFEAVSRGAAQALALDADRDAQRVIANNIATLNLADRVVLIRATANAWLQTNPAAQFDLVLCDPPHNDMQPHLLRKLAACVRPHGLFVLCAPSEYQALALQDLEFIKQRIYGNAQLLFYRAGA